MIRGADLVLARGSRASPQTSAGAGVGTRLLCAAIFGGRFRRKVPVCISRFGNAAPIFDWPNNHTSTPHACLCRRSPPVLLTCSLEKRTRREQRIMTIRCARLWGRLWLWSSWCGTWVCQASLLTMLMVLAGTGVLLIEIDVRS